MNKECLVPFRMLDKQESADFNNGRADSLSNGE